MEASDIKVGGIYRSKKPKRVLFNFVNEVVDDRQVCFVSPLGGQVQFDSPSIKTGKHYPTITMEKFLAWAGSDVTGTLPKDEWFPWSEYIAGKKAAK